MPGAKLFVLPPPSRVDARLESRSRTQSWALTREEIFSTSVITIRLNDLLDKTYRKGFLLFEGQIHILRWRYLKYLPSSVSHSECLQQSELGRPKPAACTPTVSLTRLTGSGIFGPSSSAVS